MASSARLIAFGLCLIGGVLLDAPWIAVVILCGTTFLGSASYCLSAIVVMATAQYFSGPAREYVAVVVSLLLLIALLLWWRGRLFPEAPYAAKLNALALVVRPAFLMLYLALGISVLQRSFDLWLAMALLGLLLVFHKQFTFLRIKFTELRVFEMAMLLVSLLLGALVLEAGARMMWGNPPGSNDLYSPHPEYVFLLNPNADITSHFQIREDEYAPVRYVISNQGFRDRPIPPKTPDEFRVLLLGDSFTMGHAVEAEHTIPAYLEHELHDTLGNRPVTVINGGVNGAGPLQALGMLRERGVALTPDVVLLQLFLFNDFDDCLLPVGKALHTFYVPWRYQMATLMRQNTAPYRIERFFQMRSSAYRAFISTSAFAKPWFGDALSTLRVFDPSVYVRLHPAEPILSSHLDINRRDWYPELYEAQTLLLSHVKAMHALCKQHDTAFAVYCVPHLHEVCNTRWAEDLRKHGKSSDSAFEVVRYKAIDMVEEALRSAEIPVFSVVSHLETQQEQLDTIYYVCDQHFTTEGNAIIAGQLQDYLRVSGTLPTPL